MFVFKAVDIYCCLTKCKNSSIHTICYSIKITWIQNAWTTTATPSLFHFTMMMLNSFPTFEKKRQTSTAKHFTNVYNLLIFVSFSNFISWFCFKRSLRISVFRHFILNAFTCNIVHRFYTVERYNYVCMLCWSAF